MSTEIVVASLGVIAAAFGLVAAYVSRIKRHEVRIHAAEHTRDNSLLVPIAAQVVAPDVRGAAERALVDHHATTVIAKEAPKSGAVRKPSAPRARPFRCLAECHNNVWPSYYNPLRCEICVGQNAVEFNVAAPLDSYTFTLAIDDPALDLFEPLNYTDYFTGKVTQEALKLHTGRADIEVKFFKLGQREVLMKAIESVRQRNS